MEYVGKYVVMLIFKICYMYICINKYHIHQIVIEKISGRTVIEKNSGGTNAEVMPAQWEFQVSSQPINPIGSNRIPI